MKKFIFVIVCLFLSNMCFAKDFGVIKNKRELVFQATKSFIETLNDSYPKG